VRRPCTRSTYKSAGERKIQSTTSTSSRTLLRQKEYYLGASQVRPMLTTVVVRSGLASVTHDETRVKSSCFHTSATSFRNPRSWKTATTTSRIGGRGCGRRYRNGFFVHGQTKSLIHSLRSTTTKDPNQCASWTFYSEMSVKNATPTSDAHNKDLVRLISIQLRCMRDWTIGTTVPWIPVEFRIGSWRGRRWRIVA